MPGIPGEPGVPGIKVGRRGLSYAKRYLLRVAGVIQGLQGWSALVQVRVREALFDKERGESAVCQGCEEGRETPVLSALLDFLESLLVMMPVPCLP